MLLKSLIPVFTSLFLIQAAFGQMLTVNGTTRNYEDDTPLEFATVVLLNKQDSSVLDGVNSDLNGKFQLNIQQGNYLLRVGFIGYEDLYKEIEVEKNNQNLGNFRLKHSSEIMDEVTVSGVTSMFQSDIDKRAYNVENSILAEGATATEILNTLPSVQIDEEGGISMRGSGNVLIYINGRQTNLSSEETESILAQFPANSIKSVELITNPSSRYDAAGVGGIINIILKKDERIGFNGQVNAAVGTRDKYQGGINLNYRDKKWNFYTNYNYQYRNLFELSESLRQTNRPGISPFLDQDFDTDNIRQSHLWRGGADYDVNDNLILGVYGQFNYSSRDRIRIYNQRHQGPQRQLDSLFNRTLTEDQFSTNIEAGFTLDWEIDTLGQKLYTTFSWANDYQERTEFFDQLYFDSNEEIDPSKRQDQIYGRPRQSDLFVGQLDWEKPLNGAGNLEAGIKATISLNDLAQTFEQLNLNTNQYVENDTIANRFLFDEYVFASYAIYRGNFEKLSYQVGLRAEQTITEGYGFNSETAYPNDYFNLFPSLYFSYELGVEHELLINYSRRINRPSGGQFAPFYNAQDLLNTRLGNPTLQPEYTDSYELGYVKGWNSLLLNATLYHRRTTNAMTRVYQLLDNNSAVQLWENAANRNDTGLELINQLQFGSDFSTTLSGNFFYSEVLGSNIQENFDNSNFTWTLSWLANWNIPNILSIQMQADYRGPIILPQGEVEPIYGLNIGIRKDILGKRATVSLNVTDVFNTRIYRIQTNDANFTQQRLFNGETRIGTLSFTYRFGGFKSKEESKETKYSEDPF